MNRALGVFWNIIYSSMIVTAIMGNLAVIYIVISKSLYNVSKTFIIDTK